MPEDGSALKIFNPTHDLPYPQDDCTGKTAIVTGANVGVGLEAARHFARLNAEKVILGCRSVEKGEAAKKSIEASLPQLGTSVVEVWQVDLSSFESVKEFCRRASALKRLDYLIENAGFAAITLELLEGYEASITVNVLSTYLMALLLLPVLRKTSAECNTLPVLTIVTSSAHTFNKFPQRNKPSIFDALRDDSDWNGRYALSKLLEVLINRELAKAVESSGKPRILVNAVNPGFCNTGLYRDVPFPISLIVNFLLYFFGRTAEVGSRTLMSGAFGGAETHGKYMSDCMVFDESAWVRSAEGIETGSRVYNELLSILESTSPGISNNI
ncbi:hypothetical protein BX600DRAFT_464836 [Xylariales sp. PMI_506]|nr:hypothetical protein BX600DRAFT_464836 [Xylariales sp. PMI_506]